jgi:hypothetical protein
MGDKRPLVKNSGIRSETLLGLVRNTAPFLFSGGADVPAPPYVAILREASAHLPDESDLWAYFDLCVSAHYATVGTFVPTDVDLAIREKLWAFVHSDEDFQPLLGRTLGILNWDESPVSRRFVGSGKDRLSGHQGEWLTIAMGAYATAKRIHSEALPAIREEIESEIEREERVLRALRERFLDEPDTERMREYLFGVAAVAHNLGDLDRMFDAFGIDDVDVLKRRVYRSGHQDARNPRAGFIEAGTVYQAMLAAENHRNFALRAPKGLRKSASFLLPYGPFLDSWGAGLVKEGFQAGLLDDRELREIIEALVVGWKKLNPVSIYVSQGYARALAGMASVLGRDGLLEAVPPAIQKDLTGSGLKTLLLQSREDFERKLLVRLKVLLG